MAQALVGYTGFVGQSILRTSGEDWQGRFNSKNFRDLAGSTFDHLVCAGIDARKWIANRDPRDDRRRIEALLEAIAEAHVERVTLISTVDVYSKPEEGPCEAVAPAPDQAYGFNRLSAESWFRSRFENLRILRLPALFGAGLKKNALYDLIHDNGVEKIHPGGVFQFYDMDRIASDIAAAWREPYVTRNLATEPIAIAAIARRFFPGLAGRLGASVPVDAPAPVYDVRTQLSASGYVMDAGEVEDRIAAFVARETGVGAAAAVGIPQ